MRVNKIKLNIPISLGELVDKLTILEIKIEKFTDEEKLKEVNLEHGHLKKIYNSVEKDKKVLDDFKSELKKINSKLWDIEDSIRILEINKDFGENFIQLARSVYFTNDERFDVKNKINIHFGSEISEQKQYEKYK